MISVTKNTVELRWTLANMENVLSLQNALLMLLRCQDADDVIGPEYVACIAELLQETLFTDEQMMEIERHLKSQSSKAA